MAMGGKVKTTGQGNKTEDVVKYGAGYAIVGFEQPCRLYSSPSGRQAVVAVKLRNTGEDGVF